MTDAPTILMCPPVHFGVTYRINPWMDPDAWHQEETALETESHREWDELTAVLRSLGAQLELMTPQPGLPDLVFTANAAVVMDGIALVARFRHPERQGEEPHFTAVFTEMMAAGRLKAVHPMPATVPLEGAGDCVWDGYRGCFWLGWGQRSDPAAAGIVGETFGLPVVPLQLVDPRFYHMDTALRPLPRGEILYVPDAFSAEGLREIHAHTDPGQRIEALPEDAARLAANAVLVGDSLVLSQASPALVERLGDHGYRVVQTPLDAFRRSGGSAFCLTLRLDHRSDRLAP